MSKLIKSKSTARIVFCVLALAALYVLFRFTDLRQFTSFNGIVHWVETARQQPLAVGLFYVGFIFGVMFLPITIFPIIGGVLLKFWIAAPLNILAATIGGTLSCLFSRYLGQDMARKFLQNKFKSFDQEAAEQGFKTVLVLRLVGIPPFIITNYTLGLSSVKMKDFILGTMFGILPWMVFVTYLSSHLWEAILVGGESGFAHALMLQMRPLLGLSACVLIFVVASFLIKKRKQQVKNYSNL